MNRSSPRSTSMAGFDVVKEYVLRTMTPKIAVIASNTHQQNYKAVLQQYAQKMLGRAADIYDLLDEKGPDHSKCFEISVSVNGRRFPSAWGPNKKMAEQKAALLALEELGVFDAKEVDTANRRNRRRSDEDQLTLASHPKILGCKQRLKQPAPPFQYFPARLPSDRSPPRSDRFSPRRPRATWPSPTPAAGG